MKTNVLGIISLTMGILALLLSCTGFGVILGVPAAVLGLIGTCIPGYKKGTCYSRHDMRNMWDYTIYCVLYRSMGIQRSGARSISRLNVLQI